MYLPRTLSRTFITTQQGVGTPTKYRSIQKQSSRESAIYNTCRHAAGNTSTARPAAHKNQQIDYRFCLLARSRSAFWLPCRTHRLLLALCSLTFRFLASLSALFSSRKSITSTPDEAAATCMPVFPWRSVDSTSSPRSSLVCSRSTSPSAQALTKYSRWARQGHGGRKEREGVGCVCVCVCVCVYFIFQVSPSLA